MPKTEFRKYAKQKLIQQHQKQTRGFDAASCILNKRLLHILKRLNSQNILLFMPFGFEPDVSKLAKTLRKGKYNIFMPYILNVSFKPLHFRLPFLKNKYGIFEPSISHFNLAKIDTAIIPVLGIDSDFRRVGFGKGMYDRFFAKNNAKSKKIKVIFVSRVCVFSHKIITQKHDVQGEYYISAFSESKRKKYGNSLQFSRAYNIWRTH